jgi:hypothetical protein
MGIFMNTEYWWGERVLYFAVSAYIWVNVVYL